MSKRTRLFIAVPSLGTMSSDLHFRLRQLEEAYKDHIEFIYPKNHIGRMFHDFARNGLVEEFLETTAEIIWFIDSDVVPNDSVLDIVLEHRKWKLAGAPYPVFMTTNADGSGNRQVVFTVYAGGAEKGMHPARIPYSGVDFVDGIATGCIFIKREVFAKLEKPYFSFQFNPETRGLTEGEDINFCRKVNKLGYQFYIDYSKVCKHFKQVCLLEVNNYAIEYANKSVLAYDAQIRPQIEALAAKVTAKAKPKSNLILP